MATPLTNSTSGKDTNRQIIHCNVALNCWGNHFFPEIYKICRFHLKDLSLKDCQCLKILFSCWMWNFRGWTPCRGYLNCFFVMHERFFIRNETVNHKNCVELKKKSIMQINLITGAWWVLMVLFGLSFYALTFAVNYHPVSLYNIMPMV